MATFDVPSQDWQQHLKYPTLQELALSAHGTRGNHANMGEVRAFLREHGDEDVFTDIFAVGPLESD